jgi:uncharacterized protein involved in cysteine biosynthesis
MTRGLSRQKQPRVHDDAAGFRAGAALLPRALGMLRRRRELWGPAAVPALLTVLFLGLAAAVVHANAAELMGAISSALPVIEAGAWYTWLWVGPLKLLVAASRLVLFAVAVAAALVLGLVLATLLASPVLDVLSQRVERVVLGTAAGDEDRLSATGLARDALTALAAEARRLGTFAAAWLGITAIGLLTPGGAALAPVALAALAIAFLPLEYSGFALDRRRASFAARRAWLARQRGRAIGFGAAGFAVGLVPGLNFLLLPVLVVAGTLLVVEGPPLEAAPDRPTPER